MTTAAQDVQIETPTSNRARTIALILLIEQAGAILKEIGAGDGGTKEYAAMREAKENLGEKLLLADIDAWELLLSCEKSTMADLGLTGSWLDLWNQCQ